MPSSITSVIIVLLMAASLVNTSHSNPNRGHIGLYDTAPKFLYKAVAIGNDKRVVRVKHGTAEATAVGQGATAIAQSGPKSQAIATAFGLNTLAIAKSIGHSFTFSDASGIGAEAVSEASGNSVANSFGMGNQAKAVSSATGKSAAASIAFVETENNSGQGAIAESVASDGSIAGATAGVESGQLGARAVSVTGGHGTVATSYALTTGTGNANAFARTNQYAKYEIVKLEQQGSNCKVDVETEARQVSEAMSFAMRDN